MDGAVAETKELTELVSDEGVRELPKETLDFFSGDEIRARVFYEKYALRDPSGRMAEKTPGEMWDRIAQEISSVETTNEKKTEWNEKFKWLLYDFRFVPGGRIMFGAGQGRRSSLLNCLRGDTGVLVKRAVEVTNSVLGHNNSVVSQTVSITNTVESAKIRDIIGQEVEVLTPVGWSRVTFQSYGRQKLYRILLRNGDAFFATANHEWVVRSNKHPIKKTTKQLMTYGGDNGLVVQLPARPAKDEKYYEGVVHGIVYGDGSKNLAEGCKTYSVWLFGAQRELSKYLPHAHEYSGGNMPSLKLMSSLSPTPKLPSSRHSNLSSISAPIFSLAKSALMGRGDLLVNRFSKLMSPLFFNEPKALYTACLEEKPTLF